VPDDIAAHGGQKYVYIIILSIYIRIVLISKLSSRCLLHPVYDAIGKRLTWSMNCTRFYSFAGFVHLGVRFFQGGSSHNVIHKSSES